MIQDMHLLVIHAHHFYHGQNHIKQLKTETYSNILKAITNSMFLFLQVHYD